MKESSNTHTATSEKSCRLSFNSKSCVSVQLWNESEKTHLRVSSVRFTQTQLAHYRYQCNSAALLSASGKRDMKWICMLCVCVYDKPDNSHYLVKLNER